MALNTFGWTPSEVTTDSAGNVISGVTLTVFTDVTKATQVTTLYDKDGVTALASGVVVSDNKGRFGFKASDAYSMLYVYDGSTADPWPIAAHEALDQGMASHAQAVADAQAAADSAAASAALVNAPADTVMATTVNNTSSQTRGALNTVIVTGTRASRGGNRVVYLGDSITINQANDTANNSWGISFPTFAHYLSKGRIGRTRNAGVAGDTAVQMLARFDTDVTPYAPNVVHILAGTNDWNEGNHPETTLASYSDTIKSLVAKTRAIGARPVIGTIPPNLSSAVRRKATIGANAWLRAYCRAEGIDLIDYYNLLVDPATGGIATAYNLDGTHPGSQGILAMANLLVNTLSPKMPTAEGLLPQENADPNNLVTNGLNLTTTGTGSSLMPTGWSVQSSVHPTGVTASLITGDTTIKGNWWQVAASGATSTNNEFLTVSGIIPGHKYAYVGRFKATGMRGADTGSGSTFLLGVAFNSVLNNSAYDFRAAQVHAYDVSEGTYYHEIVAPADASTALVRRQLVANTTSNGTLQVAQTGFYDLTAMGLA